MLYESSVKIFILTPGIVVQCIYTIISFGCVFRSALLQALLGLFELPEDESIPDDEHFIEIEDTPGKYIVKFDKKAY